MSENAALKALCPQTKALIIVSEYEARRMPVFQLRLVLSAVVNNDDERKALLEVVDQELRAAGHPADQVTNFLNDLLAMPPKAAAGETSVMSTRRLRSPFSMGFEGSTPTDANVVPAEQAPPKRVTGFFPTVSAPVKNEYGSIKSGPVVSSNTPPAGVPAVNPPPPKVPLPFGPPTPSAPSATGSGSRAPPPAATSATGSGSRAPAVPPAPPLPPPDMRMPVGTKTFARHEMIFGQSSGMQLNSKPTVLVADDDKRIRMVFRLRLEDAGYTVVECSEGADAWDKIQNSVVNAAVLDMKMPGLHGLEILSKMADKQMQLPVVICTAYDQLENEFVVQKYPHLRYLVKPIAPEKLVSAINELMGKPA